MGLEFEYILPFHKNKWSIFAEPTYQYYKGESELVRYIGTQGYNIKETVNIDYKSIEVPIGLRHYFFLSDSFKIFINTAFVLDFDIKNKIDFKNEVDPSNPSFSYSEKDSKAISINGSFGLGFKYNDKISLEFRHQGNRNTILGISSWWSSYKTSSLILGYTLF